MMRTGLISEHWAVLADRRIADSCDGVKDGFVGVEGDEELEIDEDFLRRIREV
jgi:hypothetical protein